MSTTTPSETRAGTPDPRSSDRWRDDTRATEEAPLTFDPDSVRLLPYVVPEGRRV